MTDSTAIRDALILIANTAEVLEASLKRDNAHESDIQAAANIRNVAWEALAKPLRNCDVGTAKETSNEK